MKKTARVGFALLATDLLAARTIKSEITPEGTTDEPHLPKSYPLTFNNDRGIFPTSDELDQMRSGLTKDDIYKTLGRLCCDEDIVGVHEWDYLFHFYTPGVDVSPEDASDAEGITICQYKVIFNRDRFARSFFWNPVFPKGAVCPPPAPKQEPRTIIREIVKEAPKHIRQ